MPLRLPLPGSAAASQSTPILTLEKIRELEKFAELGRLSAALLHEITNPLAAAILYLEQAEQQSSSLIHVRRNIRMLHSYVEAARQQLRQGSHLTSFSVRPQIKQLKLLLVPIARQAGATLQFEVIGNPKLHGDSVKFQQILANLVRNAIDAYQNCPLGGPKLVHVRVIARGKWLVVRVTDHGSGIRHDQLGQLFRPFYTTKQMTGLGIGLALVKQYVAEFDGSLRVSSSLRRGTCFSLRLPLAPGSKTTR